MLSLSREEFIENPPHYRRCSLIHHQLAIYTDVAYGSVIGDELPLTHPLLVAPVGVAGVDHGLLLGLYAPYGEYHLVRHVGGVDIFFLEVYRSPQRLELPDVVEAILHIPCKPGYRLYDDPVDLSGPAVSHEALEVLPLVRPCACEPFISVDVHQRPALCVGDQAVVVAVLEVEGMELVVRQTAHPDIWCNPHNVGQRRRGVDDLHILFCCHGPASFPRFSSNTIPQTLRNSYPNRQTVI